MRNMRYVSMVLSLLIILCLASATINVAYMEKNRETEFYLKLNTGWNFITIPLKNATTHNGEFINKASDLYNAIPGCSLILYWNTTRQDFDIYMPGSPWDFPIELGRGYIIGADKTVTVRLKGEEFNSVCIPLEVTWNALGWYKKHPTTASWLLKNIPHCSIILRLNASTQDFQVYVPGTPDFTIKQGEGFFAGVWASGEWCG